MIEVHLPLTDLATGDTVGSIEASLRAVTLYPAIATPPAPDGPIPALYTSADGVALVPPSADERLFLEVRPSWNAQTWMSVRRRLAEPPVEIAVAGPLDPVMRPFERAARTSTVMLTIAALAVIAIVVLLTRVVTSELERVASAAEAVTSGDLARRLPVTSDDEVGRLAGAFNAMIDSLRRTTEELAQKEALAAVGEFSSELAHEIRNPLTSMRLDAQRVEEVAGDTEAVRGIARRILMQVARLERAVTGALRVARSGRMERGAVDIGRVLDGARDTTEAEFAARGAELRLDAGAARGIVVDGDATALEQLFVNLLVNAAHALPGGGTASVSAFAHGAHVRVAIADNGAGMTREQLDRIREPFRSTKRNGVGLGLKIARRIAMSHGGELAIESEAGSGTTVTVTLPCVASRARHEETS